MSPLAGLVVVDILPDLATVLVITLVLILAPLIGLAVGWWSLRRGERDFARRWASCARFVSLGMGLLFAAGVHAHVIRRGGNPTAREELPIEVLLAIVYATLAWFLSSELLRRIDPVHSEDPETGPGASRVPAGAATDRRSPGWSSVIFSEKGLLLLVGLGILAGLVWPDPVELKYVPEETGMHTGDEARTVPICVPEEARMHGEDPFIMDMADSPFFIGSAALALLGVLQLVPWWKRSEGARKFPDRGAGALQ